MLVPARGGSKGVLRKNLRLVKGKPLIHHVLEMALRSEAAEVWVSTEDKEIKEVCEALEGVRVLDRPGKLAKDASTTESAMLHFAQNVDFNTIVLVQCTSPMLQAEEVNKGLRYFAASTFDSVMSVCECSGFYWLNTVPLYDIYNRPRRQIQQNINPSDITLFRETGAFYITSYRQLQKRKNRISGNVGFVELPFWTSFEIDTLEDLRNIERLMPDD